MSRALRMVKRPASAEWWTAEDVARHVNVGLRTVYREVGAGRLRAAKVGGRRAFRFRPAWVEQWMEANAAPVEIQAAVSSAS